MTVSEALRADLEAWGIAESTDGQRALVLAAALDDRDTQNVAAVDKQFGALMDALREKHAPRKVGKLALLRGDIDQAG